MNKGTSRKLRKNEVLDPNYVSIDERSLLDMIRYTLDFADFINFYGVHQNIIEGGWKKFFLHDSAFIIAEIANTKLDAFKVQNGRYDQMNDQMESVVKTRMQQLLKSNYEGSLVGEMQMLSDSIGRARKLFMNHNSTDHEKLYKKIYGDLLFIKERATKKFEEETFKSKNHFPQVGLLLAFFKLFKYIQDDINTLTQKHLDYYYRDLLGQENKMLEPHTSILALQLQQGAKDLMIHQGERFNFTMEGGHEKVFEADSTTQINTAIITDIRTLYKSEYSYYGNTAVGEKFKFNLVYDTHILEDGLNYINLKEEDNTDLPPVCGEGFLSKWESNRRVNLSKIGFLISSPALVLEKGNQSVRLIFNIIQSSYEQMIGVFQDWKQEGKTVIKTAGGHDQTRNLKDIVRDAFQLYITDRHGWKEVEQIKTKLDPIAPSLSISFRLPDHDENFVPLNNVLHEGGFGSDWPCVKILLKNHAVIHPYKFLEKLIVESITIKAGVVGVHDLKLSNSIGELDSSIPFTPFGPAPYVGSYLRIENPLIFQRNLARLKLKLEWNGLPRDLNGFEDHYREYPDNIQNTSFKAVISQSRNVDRTLRSQIHEPFELFGTEEYTNRLSSERVKEVNLEKLVFNNQIDSPEVMPDVTSEPLYLVLTHPEMALGHALFSDIYSESAMKKSRFRKRHLPLPKQPYTPVLEQLTIDYANQAKEIMLRKRDDRESDIKFMHLYPFGHVQVFPSPLKSPRFLIPQLKNKGSLYLGLKHVKLTDTISIGFDLEPAVYAHTILKKPSVEWEFLVNNEWRPFAKLILEDSTEGLIKSGIVKIRMPKTVQLDNTRLTKGHFWIRAGTKDYEDLTSKIKSIFTQAVSVADVRTALEETASVYEPHKVRKINLAVEKNLAQITGPFDLRINEVIEEESAFNCRVSERLRHKNRAVSHWDFERLILDKFKQVEKVRVYGRNSYPDELVKGSSVQVVVIPVDDFANSRLRRRSYLPYDTLVEIKNYLDQFTSPHVKIEVCNPVYELLKIRCYIIVKDFTKSGHLHNELNEELINFLSPNVENTSIEKGFDTSITRTEILNFIESRIYVDKVLELSVFQIVEVGGSYKIIDSEELGGSDRLRTISPYAILTSAPQHYINIIPDEISLRELGHIDDVSIGSDLIISNDEGNYIRR